MTRLTKEVCRILGFPEHHSKIAKHEADIKEKLKYSFMIVNGKIQQIIGFNFANNYIIAPPSDIPNLLYVESLEAWNPRAGIYKTSIGYLCFTKKSHKQWSKSFRPSNYTINGLGEFLAPEMSSELLQEIVDYAPEQICITDNNWVYFMNDPIGQFKNGEMFLHFTKYIQEVLDFIRNKGLPCTIKTQ